MKVKVEIDSKDVKHIVKLLRETIRVIENGEIKEGDMLAFGNENGKRGGFVKMGRLRSGHPK